MTNGMNEAERKRKDSERLEKMSMILALFERRTRRDGSPTELQKMAEEEARLRAELAALEAPKKAQFAA